jgi:RNA polymerase sigma factor (sigma-70 family)
VTLKEKSRDQKIKDMIPMVTAIAKRRSRPHLQEDSVSVALLAMVEAVDTYEGKEGATLETYVSVSVSGAVRDYCIFRERAMPRSGNRLTRQVERDTQEVCVDYNTVNLLGGDTARDYQEAQDNSALIEECMSGLTEREVYVINARFHREVHQAVVAKELGLSVQRVSEIERRAVQKMQRNSEG